MKTAPKEAIAKVKGQIGYCGIWCGSCVAGNGSLKELSARYLRLTEAYDLKQWAPQDFDYTQFSQGLASIATMAPCPGCLEGGGNPECSMRKCARKFDLLSCSACNRGEGCEHPEELSRMRSGAVAAGLFVKDQDMGEGPLIRKWSAELRNRWPSLLIFRAD